MMMITELATRDRDRAVVHTSVLVSSVLAKQNKTKKGKQQKAF